MKLLIISHTPHYHRGGLIVGWGPTVREIDYLTGMFEQVVHVAMYHPGLAPSCAIPYTSRRVQVVPIPASGGKGLLGKCTFFRHVVEYIRTICCELKSADVVHVRAPANISLLAMLLLALCGHPRVRWAKYAGNWGGGRREPWSYRLQRWWLRRGLHRGIVTVNGKWEDQPAHVFSFCNPCLTDEELAAAQECVVDKDLTIPVRLLFVGRLEEEKGAARVLRILSMIKQRGIPARLDMIGSSPQSMQFETLAARLDVSDQVKFHGWLPRAEINQFYAQAHFMLLPSTASEGWPKVLSEAMAHGAVILAGRISSIPGYLSRFETGQTCDSYDLAAFADAIGFYCEKPDVWRLHSRRGSQAATEFTYDSYLHELKQRVKLKACAMDGTIANPARPKAEVN